MQTQSSTFRSEGDNSMGGVWSLFITLSTDSEWIVLMDECPDAIP